MSPRNFLLRACLTAWHQNVCVDFNRLLQFWIHLIQKEKMAAERAGIITKSQNHKKKRWKRFVDSPSLWNSTGQLSPLRHTCGYGCEVHCLIPKASMWCFIVCGHIRSFPSSSDPSVNPQCLAGKRLPLLLLHSRGFVPLKESFDILGYWTPTDEAIDTTLTAAR